MNVDPTVVMADQMWRVFALTTFDASIRAVIYGAMLYVVLRVALRDRT